MKIKLPKVIIGGMECFVTRRRVSRVERGCQFALMRCGGCHRAFEFADMPAKSRSRCSQCGKETVWTRVVTGVQRRLAA